MRTIDERLDLLESFLKDGWSIVVACQKAGILYYRARELDNNDRFLKIKYEYLIRNNKMHRLSDFKINKDKEIIKSLLSD